MHKMVQNWISNLISCLTVWMADFNDVDTRQQLGAAETINCIHTLIWSLMFGCCTYQCPIALRAPVSRFAAEIPCPFAIMDKALQLVRAIWVPWSVITLGLHTYLFSRARASCRIKHICTNQCLITLRVTTKRPAAAKRLNILGAKRARAARYGTG
jgi:hypothetical protein